MRRYHTDFTITASSDEQLEDLLKNPILSQQAVCKHYAVSEKNSRWGLGTPELLGGGAAKIHTRASVIPLSYLKTLFDYDSSIIIEVVAHDDQHGRFHSVLTPDGNYEVYDQSDYREELLTTVETKYRDSSIRNIKDWWLLNQLFTTEVREWIQTDSGKQYGDVIPFPIDLISEYYQKLLKDEPEMLRIGAKTMTEE